MGNEVLVLLDDLLFQVKIADAAKRAGVRVLFVKDPELFLQMAQTNPPQGLILDLNLSGADTIGVVQRVKASGRLQGVPLIAYLSHVQTELRAAAMEAGCERVMARSAFVQTLAAIMSDFAKRGDLNLEGTMI
jgi:CheY-like chemotaxis protein